MKNDLSRKLVAIMFTDIVGYSRLMSSNEEHAIRLLDQHDATLAEAIAQFGGKILKRMGDAILAQFDSATNAVRCGIDIQQRLKAHNETHAQNEQLCVRIGIHLGDVIVRENDLFGDGINVAARLEPLAQPGGICISQAVFQAIKASADIAPVLVGEVELKNILEKHVIYQIPPFYDFDSETDAVRKAKSTKSDRSRLKITHVESLSPPQSAGVIVSLAIGVTLILTVIGGAVGLSLSPKSSARPYFVLGSELKETRQLAESLLEPKLDEIAEISRLMSAKGKSELRAALSDTQSDANGLRTRGILVDELNGVIASTHPLNSTSGSSRSEIAQANRQALEARFKEHLSVLLMPRDFITRTDRNVRDGDPTTLRVLAFLVFTIAVQAVFAYVLLRPAMTRYVFDDVRDVDDIQEYLMTELGFRSPKRLGKNVVFRASVITFLTWGVTKMVTRIDGNSLIISGPRILVRRFAKALNAYAGASAATQV